VNSTRSDKPLFTSPHAYSKIKIREIRIRNENTEKIALGLSISALMATGAQAEAISDGVVKIGVLGDMGGVYADICGPDCVTAAQMAVEDVSAV
tara:strand:+ start:249 stop:530 length:282 start_codon:yes stop_codon:yes gene_type:complete